MINLVVRLYLQPGDATQRDGDLDLLTTEERDRLGVVWYGNPAR